MAENRICTEFVLRVSITGSSGRPLWRANQKLGLIRKALGFEKSRSRTRRSTAACPNVEIRSTTASKTGDQLFPGAEMFPD